MGVLVPARPPNEAAPDRPDGRQMRIGRDVMNFDWGDHRERRWILLCAEMLGGSEYVRTMTALLNLDWRHSTEEKAIPDRDLLSGFRKYVWPLLNELGPRLACPLTKRVWRIVRDATDRIRVPFPPCPIWLPQDPIVLELPGCGFPTILIKPHNHPSRALSNDQIVQVGRVCRWFLDGSSAC
jgi:hypothetical protein